MPNVTNLNNSPEDIYSGVQPVEPLQPTPAAPPAQSYSSPTSPNPAVIPPPAAPSPTPPPAPLPTPTPPPNIPPPVNLGNSGAGIPPSTLSLGGTPLSQPPKKSRRAIWITLIIVIIGGIFGGGYFAYSRGYIAIPFLTPDADALFDKMVSTISDIKNAQYTVRVGITSEPRSPDATPIYQDKNTNSTNSSNQNTNSANVNSDVTLNLFGKKVHLSSNDTETPTFSVESIGDQTGLGVVAAETNVNTNTSVETNLNQNENVGTTNGNENSNTSGSNEDVATPFSIESIGEQVGLGDAGLGLGSGTFNNDYLDSIAELASSQELFQFVPSDVNLSGAVTVYLETDKKTSEADGFVKIDGTYSGGDLTAALNLESRKIDKTIFGIINKFPSLGFFDTTAIKGKWVSISPEDDQEWITDETLDQFNLKDNADKLKQVVRHVLESKVFAIKQKLPSQMIEGVKSEHYLITIEPERLNDLYDRMIKEKQDKGETVEDLQAAKTALQDADNMALLKRVAQNSKIEIWVDKVSGYLRQVSWALTMVPPGQNEKLKDKQFVLSTTFTLEKVNENVGVDRPGNTISYDEAARLVSGISQADQLAQKQVDRITKLQSMLKSYHTLTGTYPETLTNLDEQVKQAKTVCEQKQKETNTNENQNTNTAYSFDDYGGTCYVSDYYLRPARTIDVFTGKEFVYQKDGENFKLTYQMKLTGTDQFKYYAETYAEGTNTMVNDDVSVEKESDSDAYYKDTDQDKLTDAQEQTYKTDKTKRDTDEDGLSDYDEVYKNYTTPTLADTDGDGTNDGDEVKNGTNPNNSSSTSTNQNTNSSISGETDTDSDRLSDSAELGVYHTNPNKRDTDDDQLSDYAELLCETDPLKSDTDSDTYPDKTEIDNGYNPRGAGKADTTACQNYVKQGY